MIPDTDAAIPETLYFFQCIVMHSRDTAIQEESIQVLQNGSPLQVSIAITLSQEEEGTANIGCLYYDVIKFTFLNIFVYNCL